MAKTLPLVLLLFGSAAGWTITPPRALASPPPKLQVNNGGSTTPRSPPSPRASSPRHPLLNEIAPGVTGARAALERAEEGLEEAELSQETSAVRELEAEAKAREHGCRMLTLSVLNGNAARRLYERFGFVAKTSDPCEDAIGGCVVCLLVGRPYGVCDPHCGAADMTKMLA